MPEAKNSVVKKEESKKDKFDWADEGLSALVRVVILSWSAAILTLNYVTIPGVPQKNIDPTFMASVFTGTPATFGVTPAKKKDDSDSVKKEDDKKAEFDYEFEVVFDKEKETTIQKIKRWIKKQKPPFDVILMHLFSYVEIWYWEGKVLQTMSHVDSQVDDIHRLWANEHETEKHTRYLETGVFGEEEWLVYLLVRCAFWQRDRRV